METALLPGCGIRVPFIVRWLGTIPAGTVSHRNIHCIDDDSTWRPKYPIVKTSGQSDGPSPLLN